MAPVSLNIYGGHRGWITRLLKIVPALCPGTVVILDIDADFIAGGEISGRDIVEVVIALDTFLTVMFRCVIELRARLQPADILDVLGSCLSHVLPHHCG